MNHFLLGIRLSSVEVKVESIFIGKVVHFLRFISSDLNRRSILPLK